VKKQDADGWFAKLYFEDSVPLGKTSTTHGNKNTKEEL
jgi:hypothetical protein